MDFNDYQRLAFRTANKQLSDNDQLLCGALGLCNEAGEAVGIVKKWRFQGHDLDRDKFKRELGDVLWYLADCASALGISLDEIAEGNIKKLEERFPEGFEVARSVHRKEV